MKIVINTIKVGKHGIKVIQVLDIPEDITLNTMVKDLVDYTKKNEIQRHRS